MARQPVNSDGPGAPGKTAASAWAGETALAARLFEDIRAVSADKPGVTREAYGPGENAAWDRLADTARRFGLRASRDPAANLILHLPHDDLSSPGVLCGSHLDSVPHGGNYDGLAGVVAGLLCLLRLHKERDRPLQPFRVVGFRCEESAWFGKPYIGSSLAMGVLPPSCLDLVHRSLGLTLAQCLEQAGVDVKLVRAGRPLMDAASVEAYVEAHIEQGPVMIARDIPVAVVSGIRGNIRHPDAVCLGEEGHSGAVPRELRHDAVFAFAELAGAMDAIWGDMLTQGHDLVVTCGVAHTDKRLNAVTRIPGEFRFSLEARSQNPEDMKTFMERLGRESERIGRKRGVAFDFGRALSSAPASLTPGLRERLQGLQKALGLPEASLPSGAGHDAAVFAQAGIAAAMLFIRNDHGSHNPQETMEIGDLLAAVNILHAWARGRAPKEPSA
jgi:N-carbamoyl-L-amino-acid hydrolase